HLFTSTKCYALSLHDALPIYERPQMSDSLKVVTKEFQPVTRCTVQTQRDSLDPAVQWIKIVALKVQRHQRNFLISNDPMIYQSRDRKSTRLNSSHGSISYAVF